MYIRSRQEALDNLSEILAQPDRTTQIVQVTIQIPLCLDADSRDFLVDCQRTIIENGLDEMRKRRQESLAAMQDETFDGIVIIDTEKDELLEEMGTAFDTMRMVDVVREVFPNLAGRYPSWKIGRAILTDQAAIREHLIAAVRHRGKSDHIQLIESHIETRVKHETPDWSPDAPTLRTICHNAIANGATPDSPADDPDFVYSAIALYDGRTRMLFDLANSHEAHAREFINEIRKRIQIIHEAEQRQSS